MKLTQKGYRISKNGSIIDSIEKEAIRKDTYQGELIKEEGTYFYFSRKQGDVFLYLP